MKHTKTEIPITKLVGNSGQIPGVPKNPRTWTQGDVMRLAKSIQETPELLELRGLIAVEHEGKYVVLGGNLRLAAGKFLNLKTMPVEVVEDCTTAKLKEIAIKDNGAFGQWDASALLEEWGDMPLKDWGVDGWQVSEDGSIGESKQQKASLNDRFVVPPFSILDTRKGYWQARKNMWREQIGDLGESRKVVKMHQNVLVFYKGDPKKIRTIFPKMEYTLGDEQMFASEAAADGEEQAVGAKAADEPKRSRKGGKH